MFVTSTEKIENNKIDEKFVLDKTRNAKKGIVSGIINKVITLLIPFIVRTLFIKVIGIEYAGLNSLFTSLLQVLNLAELGFASAVVYSMYKPIADRDNETICALLNFYRHVYKIVGAIVLGVGILVLPFIKHFINGTPPSDINIYIVYLVFLLNTSISYLLYGYKTSLLNAYQRTDVINYISSITTLGLNLAYITVLLLVPNYYLYIIFLPVFTILNNLILSRTVDKMFPQYKCEGTITDTMRIGIWKKIKGLAIQKVCEMSRDMFSSIFISAFLSLAFVGIYNNYFMILNAITGMMAIIINSMIGAIGNTVATTTVEENYKILQKFNCMFMWVSTVVATCFFSLLQPFMKIWMGEQYMFGNTTVILFTLYFYVLRMGDIRSIWVSAVGLFWEIRWRAVLEAVLNLVLGFTFIRIWGVNGLLIGTLISLFFVNFIYSSSITFKYYFGYKRLAPYYLTQFLHLFIVTLSCGIVYYSCISIEKACLIHNLWVTMAERLVISILVSNTLLFTFLHQTSDYRFALDWIKTHYNKPTKRN